MAEYIDKQALIAEFKRLSLGENSLIEKIFADGVYAVIETFPKADVAPVRRGKWLDVQETDYYVPDYKITTTKTAETCSECKVRIGFIGAKEFLFDGFCPNCGAYMGGREDV